MSETPSQSLLFLLPQLQKRTAVHGRVYRGGFVGTVVKLQDGKH